MDNRIKYLNNVLKYILEDTLIEIREDGNYINFPFFEGDDKYYPLGNSFLPTNFFYRPTSFFEYCRDMYGLTVDEIEDMWEKYRTTIRNRTSKRNINESVGRKDDYLNRVTQFIVDDTIIEYTSYGTIKFIPPFFKGYRYYEYEKNEEFILPFYSPLEFTEYCNNLYGLSDMKTIFTVWGKYKKLLSNNYQQSINESVNISDNKRFNDYVINDIIKNTSLEGHHFYLFDCNISVHLNHSRYNPFFEWVPECFYTIMDRHYGLDFDVSHKVWSWYSEYIIDLYLKKFRR